mgnify:CR=1 FL=1
MMWSISPHTLQTTYPSECIVFEDATAGIEAAKKAGMTAIAFGDPSEFVAADFCFSDFDAIGKELLSKLF